MTRRLAVQMLLAAGEFWARKPASEWSDEEIARLLHDSPWAKDVNADFDTDAEAAGPSIGRGGQVVPPSGRTRRRQPVLVIWESALAVLETKHISVGPQFAGRYVLSAGEIPFGVMERHRTSANPNETALDQRRRMTEELMAAATLEAKGKSPVQPGLVGIAPRAAGIWLFGFSKELLAIDRDDSEVTFSLKTGLVTLRAKFEPRKMIYKGALSL